MPGANQKNSSPSLLMTAGVVKTIRQARLTRHGMQTPITTLMAGTRTGGEGKGEREGNGMTIEEGIGGMTIEEGIGGMTIEEGTGGMITEEGREETGMRGDRTREDVLTKKAHPEASGHTMLETSSQWLSTCIPLKTSMTTRSTRMHWNRSRNWLMI